MGELGSIAKSFTRFFIPGLAFSVFGILLPLYLWTPQQLPYADVTPSIVLLSAILFGYVLDSIKGYRWTFCLRAYMKEKTALTQQLHSIVNEDSKNPDDFIAELWLHDKEVYERIFQERAEWVMILETAFSVLVGGGILSVLACIDLVRTHTINPKLVLPCAVYFVVSWAASRNGIDRMIAHDKKLVHAVRASVARQRSGVPLSPVPENEATQTR